MKNSFIVNITTLISGNVLAQALPILLSPWLSRIYTPTDFAALSLILPIISIGALISTLRLDVAIVIPKEDKEAIEIITTAILLNWLITIFSIITVIVIVFFIENQLIWNNTNKNIFWLVPLGIFSVSLYSILNYWSTRCKTYKINALSKVIQSVTTVLFSIFIGYIINGPTGLISGFVFGYLLGALFLLFKQKNILTFLKITPYNFQIINKLIKKYRNFVVINTPHSILDILVDQGIIYLFKIYFTERILGSFAFAFRYIRAPISIITSSISQVFYEQSAKLTSENKDIRPLMLKIQKKLFLVGIIPFVIIFSFTPDLFAFIFSEDYRQAGEIARYLLPWIFVNYLVSPISPVTLIFKKQREAFIITIIDFLVRIVLIVCGGLFFNYKFSFISISFFCSFILIFANVWYYRIAIPNKKYY